MSNSAEKLIEAYFKGGNAQGKRYFEIGKIMQVIIDVVEKGKYEEKGNPSREPYEQPKHNDTFENG